MNKKIILFISALIFSFSLISQEDKETDSLINLLNYKKDRELIPVLNALTGKFRNINPEQAKSFHKKALSLSQKYNDEKGLGDYYNNSAKFHYFEGNYDEAIIDYQKSFLYRQKTNDTIGIANVLGNLGVTYRKKGDYVKALEYYQKSLEIKQRFKDKSDAIGTINNIGGLYYYQRNYDKAAEYYNSALEMAQQINDSNFIGIEYGNLALVFDDKGEHDKALEFALKAFKIREKNGQTVDVAISYNNIGRIYEHLKNNKLALEYYLKAAKLYNEIGDEPSKCNTLYNIGDLNLKAKNYTRALLYLDSSFVIAKKLNHRTQLRDLYFSMAMTHHGLKNNDLAFEYLHEHTILNDSIYDEEGLEQLSEMEAKYQNQEQEHKIEKLKQENEIKILKETQSKKDFRNIVIISISSLAVLIALILILFIRNRTKKKANDSLIAFNNEIVLKKEIIEEQKQKIEHKQKEIVDSINYAKRLQETILPDISTVLNGQKEIFVLYKPKDIVAGDFYWSLSVQSPENDEIHYLACCDCTGHGVPGAFMSLLSSGLINEAIKEKGILEPNKIFNYTRERLIQTISKDAQQDGFDGVLVRFNFTKKTIDYAAANCSPILIENDISTYLNCDKMPVGKGIRNDSFQLFKIPYETGSTLYIFTDGYADQFGGSKTRLNLNTFGQGKKFKYKQLNELLTNIYNKPLIEQSEILNEKFNSWKGNLEQVDDVCIIGIKL